MLKHGYALAFTAGLLLLVAAGLLLLAPHGNAATDTLDQRLHIQDALVDLGPCLTCHSETAAPASQDALVARSAAAERDAVLAETASNPVQDRLNEQLVTLGHRLLELPEAQASTAQAAALMDGYLHAYEATRADAGQATLMKSLALLDDLSAQLAGLEADAAPVKLVSSLPAAPRCEPVTARVAPPSIPIADHLYLALVSTDVSPASLLETHPRFVQDVCVILVHRRGPPSDLGVESVL